MWVRCLGWEDPLEEGMATHSSVLAWRIPWTEKPDGLQSIGSQRVRYDWSNLAHTHRNLWMWPYLETVFADVTRMRLSWMRVGPKFNDWHTHRKTVMWTKAEIWSHAPTSQKHQRAQKTTRSSEEVRKDCPLKISGRAWSCWHPECKLPVCGNLLQQPQESNSHGPPAYRTHLWRCFCRTTWQMSWFQISQID